MRESNCAWTLTRKKFCWQDVLIRGARASKRNSQGGRYVPSTSSRGRRSRFWGRSGSSNPQATPTLIDLVSPDQASPCPRMGWKFVGDLQFLQFLQFLPDTPRPALFRTRRIYPHLSPLSSHFCSLAWHVHGSPNRLPHSRLDEANGPSGADTRTCTQSCHRHGMHNTTPHWPDCQTYKPALDMACLCPWGRHRLPTQWQ